MTSKLGRARSTGFRTLDYTSLLGAETAERFAGLSPDTTKSQVLATFKRASSALGIPARLRDVVDLLFKYSMNQDWEPGQRPVVWPSNQRLMDELDLGLRQVQYTIRELVKLGLITMVDSANGQRQGRRDANGYIIWAYGFDLSPLAVNRPAFQAAIAQADAYRAERTRLRREITIARRAVQNVAETALDQDLDGADWEDLAERAERAAQGAGRENDLVVLVGRLEALETLRKEAEDTFKKAVTDHDSSPMGAEKCIPLHTTHLQFAESNTVDDNATERPRHCTAQQERSSRDRPKAATGQRSDTSIDEIEASLDSYRITPRFLVHISPDLREALQVEDPDWRNIVEAAYVLRSALGISDDAWGRGCGAMGRRGAAAAVAVIAARQDHIKRPGGYFRGMTRKALEGKLNLGPSVFKIRDEQAGAA